MVERLMKPAEVAEALGLSLSQVYRMAELGELPVWQRKQRGAVRFRVDDVRRFIESNMRHEENND